MVLLAPATVSTFWLAQGRRCAERWSPPAVAIADCCQSDGAASRRRADIRDVTAAVKVTLPVPVDVARCWRSLP